MNMIYGKIICEHHMCVIIYLNFKVNHMWTSYTIIIYDQDMWTSYTVHVIIYGYQNWINFNLMYFIKQFVVFVSYDRYLGWAATNTLSQQCGSRRQPCWRLRRDWSGPSQDRSRWTLGLTEESVVDTWISGIWLLSSVLDRP